jgi:integrase
VAHLRRPPYTKPVPPDAEIFTRKGNRFARFEDRKGRTVEAPLSEDGQRVRLKSRVGHGYYRDANGDECDVALSTDKTAAQQMLNELLRKAELARAGIANPHEEHHKRPLLEHLADYRRHLEDKGDTTAHAAKSCARVRRILDGCRFVFIRDLSGSVVQAFLADLRKRGRPRVEPPIGQEKFTKAELVSILGVHPHGVAALLRRHELDGEGNGRRRRYSRAVVAYLQERLCRGAGTTTVNAYLQAAKSFTAWLVRDRRTGDNPLAHLSGGNARLDPRHERRALPVQELRLLLETAGDSAVDFRGLSGQDRAMLYGTAMGTGFRAAELASLRPESFDLSADPPTATVAAAYVKNRQQATQPLPNDLADALRCYLEEKAAGQPVWPGSWSNDAADMLRIDLEAAGIPYRDAEWRVADFHALRHSFISVMAQSGIHPKLAQSLARHSTITLTMDRYAHVQLYDQAAAVAALPSVLPRRGPIAERLLATGTDGNWGANSCASACASGEETCDSVRSIETSPSGSDINMSIPHPPMETGDRIDCDPVRADEKSGPSRTRTCNQGIMSHFCTRHKVGQAIALRHVPEAPCTGLTPARRPFCAAGGIAGMASRAPARSSTPASV